MNVYHHGEGDKEVVWNLGPDDTVLEGEQPIQVYREPFLNVTPRVIADLSQRNPRQRTIWLGKQQGQHSGVENCVMRYDTAEAYEQFGQPGGRYSITEVPGARLCNASAGTGVNELRDPQIRYGDAADKRGSCMNQILVNDAISAPVR